MRWPKPRCSMHHAATPAPLFCCILPALLFPSATSARSLSHPRGVCPLQDKATVTFPPSRLKNQEEFETPKGPPNRMCFSGTMFNRGSMAQAGMELPGGKGVLAETEGLTLRVGGDGNQYSCAVTTSSGATFVQRFFAPQGFSDVRLPWGFFRAQGDAQEGARLDPTDITRIAVRFEPRIGLAGAVEVSPSLPCLCSQ